jgi:hypothetical protein
MQSKAKMNHPNIFLAATLLTCGDVTPSTDKTTAVTQHNDETESTGSKGRSAHSFDSKLLPTHLARAVSEATLICVQAVTTRQSQPSDYLLHRGQVNMLTRTEDKGTAVDQEDTGISSLRLSRGQEDDVAIEVEGTG